MAVDVTERACGDRNAYELIADGTIVASLAWVSLATHAHRAPGWWLEVPGRWCIVLYEVPPDRLGDLDGARRESESACRFFAREILSDRISGLSDLGEPPRGFC